MTKLLYRGHTYEQNLPEVGDAKQLRYHRDTYQQRQQQLRSSHQLTYRGRPYTSDRASISSHEGHFVYRGVSYTR